MPDTSLSDNNERRVPPTVRDPKPRRWLWVVVPLAALLLIGAGVGAYLYFRFVDYQPTAHLHVPEGSNVAIRVDGMQLFLFKPVREHIWPVLEGLKQDEAKTPPSPSSLRGRLLRIQKATGVAIPRDIRDVVIAAVDPKSWVVLIGGVFPKGRFVKGLDQVLRQDGLSGWTLSDDMLVSSLGPAIAQASDGTIILGSNKGMVSTALPAASTVKVPVPVEGAASFLVNQQAWSSIVSLLPLTVPGVNTLSHVEQVTGSLALDDAPKLTVDLEPKSGVDATVLARDIDSFVTTARALTLLVPSDLGGAKQAMSDAQIEARNGEVHIVAPWSYDALDKLLGQMAALLNGEKPAPATSATSLLSLPF